MDIGTGLALFGTAKLAEKLLGPTAEYLGSGLKDYTQKAIKNLDNIFSSAMNKVKNLDDGYQVSPRTLKNVVSEGAFCEDELTAEYFSGVLASSRTPTGRDDRGATLAALLGRLSNYQIRTHYLIYRAIRDVFSGGDYNFDLDDRPKLRIFIPYSSYLFAMEFSSKEMKQNEQILSHSFFGLGREDLVESFFYGSIEPIKKKLTNHPLITEGGILVIPSAFGAELYLWVHGFGHFTRGNLLKTDFPQLDGEMPKVKTFSAEELRKKS